jgi:hypothetical protein
MIQVTTTLADLLRALQGLTAEQLAQPAQVVRSHPVAEHVFAARPVICLGTVDGLGLRYVRSSRDNRRHGDEVVLFIDGNPFARDGAIAYQVTAEDPFGEGRPIYPPDHAADRDWSGPAQKLVDATMEELPDGSLRALLRHRLQAYDKPPGG